MTDAKQPQDAAFRPAGHADDELISGLEPDQLVANSSQPFPRMRIGKATAAFLWVLRLFVFALAAIVVATFIASLRQ